MKISSKNYLLSTSNHSLNADRKLTFIEKIKWLFFNFINNNTFPKKPEYNKFYFIEKFSPKFNSEEINELLIGDSPSRTIGNLFWKNVNWDLIKNEMGEINIFDTGCGAGEYGLKINDFALNRINSYYGIDFKARDNWNQIMTNNPFIFLKESSSSNVKNLIPKNTNFIMTQSAIEHFSKDLEYFYQIKDFIEEGKRNIIQIHLFPSPACLWLYLFHGYRQYNLNSINKIIKIFKEQKCYYKIFPLGGNKLNQLHFRFITIPSLLKKRINLKSNNYKNFLKRYMQYEITKGNNYNPSFYALVIHSNFRNKVF